MSVQFDSEEYWLKHIWDRDVELAKASSAVRDEWRMQEELTVAAMVRIVNRHTSPVAVLDLPCGTGRIARLICDSVDSRLCLTVADVHPGVLAQLKKRVSGCDIAVVRASAYDIGETHAGQFDVIVCLDFLHHVADLPRFVRAIENALRSGGILIANAFAGERFHEWETLKYGPFKAALRLTGRKIAELVYASSPEHIRTLIRRLGLARIAPLSETEMEGLFQHGLKKIQVVSGYYYWIEAQKR